MDQNPNSKNTSYLHFGDVSILKNGALVQERRVVAHDVVDADASREGNASLELLALLACKGLLDFVLNHGVNGGAHSGDVGARHTEFGRFGQAR